MKHSILVTSMLIMIFALSQVVGLFTVSRYIDISEVNGTIQVNYPDTLLGEPPEVENKSMTFVPLILTILVGTAFIFVLIHFNLGNLWKYWFLFAVVITMSLAFDVHLTFKGSGFVAFLIALALGLIKVFKPNVFVHNLTEIFVYTGITIAILPFLNLTSAFMMLVLISIYDAIAVWKSRHMIKLAEFQSESKVFAGLLIPYRRAEKKSVKEKKKPAKMKVVKSMPVEENEKGPRTAILGGGDIAFPMLFSATVIQHLVMNSGFALAQALMAAYVITATTAIALGSLLIFGKEDKFYPAMPFISLGCVIGYLIILSF